MCMSWLAKGDVCLKFYVATLPIGQLTAGIVFLSSSPLEVPVSCVTTVIPFSEV